MYLGRVPREPTPSFSTAPHPTILPVGAPWAVPTHAFLSPWELNGWKYCKWALCFLMWYFKKIFSVPILLWLVVCRTSTFGIESSRDSVQRQYALAERYLLWYRWNSFFRNGSQDSNGPDTYYRELHFPNVFLCSPKMVQGSWLELLHNSLLVLSSSPPNR